MDPIELQIAQYTEERAKAKKLGFIFGFTALGIWVLNAVVGTMLANMAIQNGSFGPSLGITSFLSIAVPVLGLLGVGQRNKAVKARNMLRNLELLKLQVAQTSAPAAAAQQPTAVAPAQAAPATASRAAKARKTKS